MLYVSENRVMRDIFGPYSDKGTGYCKKNNVMSLMIRISHHFQRDQIRDDKMGGAHDT